MPNLHKIYHDTISPIEIDSKQDVQKQLDESSSREQVHNWLQATVTQRFLKSISQEIEDLETQARQLAVTYPQHNNHQQIIQLLTRSSELRKINDHAK